VERIRIGSWNKVLLPCLVSMEDIYTETHLSCLEKCFSKAYMCVSRFLEEGRSVTILSGLLCTIACCRFSKAEFFCAMQLFCPQPLVNVAASSCSCFLT
jgi:hypothetical protein